MSTQITDEFIAGCRAARACREGLAWVSRKPRPTLAELAAYRKDWAEWAAIHVACLTDAERDELYELTGTRSWWRNGLRHREDGPAVEWANGTRQWFRDGKLHRDDGPAFEGANGTRLWYRDGKLHRDDGPAVEWADGSREWWRDGMFVRVERAS